MPRFPAFWLLVAGAEAPSEGAFSERCREKTVDRSSRVHPFPLAAQGTTDGLAERRCSGHVNQEGESQ